MCDLYKRIYDLCQRKGISIGKMCAELNISRGNLTELKMGRIKTLKADNLTKISTFFGVTIDYLLTGLPANIYECPNDENPWEVELLDAFDRLDIDMQIQSVEHLRQLASDPNKKTPALNEKDKRDIARSLEQMMSQLEDSSDLMFDGNPMSDEARESIRQALQMGLEIAKVKNKERFTPHKYRKG